MVGFGLAHIWTVEGHFLVVAPDVNGEVLHCTFSLESFQDPMLLADGFVSERTHIEKWLRKHDTSPCVNKALSHKALLKLRPWHAALSKFLLEDSSRRISRDNLESASRKAESALLSSEPLES